METQEQSQPCQTLAQLDQSAAFLVGLVLALLLALQALGVEKARVQGAQTGSVYPLRLTSSALTVGGVGWFFTLAERAWREADASDPAACRSARSNLAAAGLVLAAALLRLEDVQQLHQAGRL